MSHWVQCNFVQKAIVWVDPSCSIKPLVGGGYHPSQGLPPSVHARAKTREQIRREREDYGILPKVSEVIEAVAESQAKRLEQDKQKQLEELHRELELKGIQWESRYLELLGQLREHLIDQEIKDRLRKIAQEKELLSLLLLAGSA